MSEGSIIASEGWSCHPCVGGKTAGAVGFHDRAYVGPRRIEYVFKINSVCATA